MKKNFTYYVFSLLVVSALGLTKLQAQVNISAGQTIQQDFDGIGTSLTATLPIGWKMSNSSSLRTVTDYASAGTVTTQRAGNNMSSTASWGLYNFGAGDPATAGDRALGGLSSSNANSKSFNIFVNLYNSGAGDINDFTISYDVEKYRDGTNSAGFSIQMYYSTDGSIWTSAGNDFLTSFAGGDANNNGYASAPGATVSVSGKTLNVSLAANSHLYLAWNYSVTSGSTTTNAQALGIDDVSITANGTSPCSTPTLSASITHATFGNNNGAIDLTVTGGTAPFTYSWVATTSSCIQDSDCAYMGSHGFCDGTNCRGEDEDLSNLPPGTYEVTVTASGSGNCVATATYTVEELKVKNENQNKYYFTIQAAVDDAENNDVIKILAAEHTEPTQVLIDKNLTIRGQGMANTTVYPGSDTDPDNISRGFFKVGEGAVVTFSDFTFDGMASGGRLIKDGFLFRGSGEMHKMHVKNIFFSKYEGYAVNVGSDDEVNIYDSKFENIQREAVLYWKDVFVGNNGSEFKRNEVIGKGPGDWVDYGIEVSAGSKVAIEDNYFHGFTEDGTYSDYGAAAINASTYFGPGTEVVIKNNIITDNFWGIVVGLDEGDRTVADIDMNDLSNNVYSVARWNDDDSLYLGCNWYGTLDVSLIDAGFDDDGTKNIFYCSVLNSGGDDADQIGFQPTGTCVDKYIVDVTLSGGPTYVFSHGSSMNLKMDFQNLNNVEYEGDVEVKLTIKDEGGAVHIYDKTMIGADWRTDGWEIELNDPDLIGLNTITKVEWTIDVCEYQLTNAAAIKDLIGTNTLAVADEPGLKPSFKVQIKKKP
ncbi:MAG: SprB repeat-containing protein [Bacteroidales bacterium]